MKKIIAIIFAAMLLASMSCSFTPAIALEEPAAITYEDYLNFPNLIEAEQQRMDNAHIMAEAARALGFVDSDVIIQSAKEIWHEAFNNKAKYQNDYAKVSADWEARRQEYDQATFVWEYFKKLGYSDVVCAGMMGNFMVETGGYELTLKYDDISPGGSWYGIAQWNKIYYPDVWYTSLEEQCDYLENTIRPIFKEFGGAYKRGFTYNDFLVMDSSSEAALCFAKVYERCSGASYHIRQNCAIKAYNYYVGEYNGINS